MRRLHGLLLVLALSIAGCAAPGPDVDAAVVDPDVEDAVVVARPAAAGAVSAAVAAAPRALAFGEPVALPQIEGFGGGEPNIAALPDGTLFATAPTGGAPPNALRGGGYLWRSQDAGASWEMLRGPDAPGAGTFCSCDSDVVTSPDGWVYYTDWWLTGAFVAGTGNYLVERSPDGGETWEASPITTRDALLNNVDRQWLVAGPDGFVGLFYSYFSAFGIHAPVTSDTTRGVHAVFSRDHGASWSDPVVVVSGGSWQIAHPIILPDGTLAMPYGAVSFQDGFWRDPSTVMLAVSTDGVAWEQHEVAEAPEGFDNLWAVQGAADASGAIHVAWSARVDDDRMATYVATSRDQGESWTSPLALRESGLNFLPWVATFGEDTVAVGWYGGDATGDPEDAETPWFAYLAQSVDGGETFAVQRVSDEPVKEGPMCPRGAACRDDRELLDYVSMVYDSRGTLHYAFARSDGGEALAHVASAVALP